jgi:hypothetical protein
VKRLAVAALAVAALAGCASPRTPVRLPYGAIATAAVTGLPRVPLDVVECSTIRTC